ncbi:MAG: hypothetical protein RL095_532 [Verrucomicrobiota bacterium]|jgi:antitoxin component YwqK of YwqJK toxin-antitoxin module
METLRVYDDSYPADDFSGIFEAYYPSKKIKFRSAYRNGVEFGQAICYWENGQIAQIGENDDEGKGVGRWVDYDEDGRISKEVNYLSGKLHGPRIVYYKDGSIMSQELYSHGKRLDSPQL